MPTTAAHRTNWHQVRSSGTSSVGSAPLAASLDRVVDCTAAAFRGLWAAGTVVTVSAWALLGAVSTPAVVIASGSTLWAIVIFLLLFTYGRLPAWLAVADLSLFTALLLAVGLLVPAQLVGDGTTWVFTGTTVSVLLAGWLLPPTVALGGTAVLTTAYFGGVALAGRSPLEISYMTTAFMLIIQGCLGVAVLAVIRRATKRADLAVARRVATEQADKLEAQRQRNQREQERIIHDNVRNTLWLLGHGHFAGQTEPARDRAAEAAKNLHELASGRIPSPPRGALIRRLAATVDEANSVSLRVEFVVEQIPQRRRHGWSRRLAQPTGRIPTVVVDAVCGATQQALSNVRIHANAAEAFVVLHNGPSCLIVTISDRGTGFVTDVIHHTDKHGILDSIMARMSEVGGSATVQSSTPQQSPEDHGTIWTLKWDGAVVAPLSPAAVGVALNEYGRGFVYVFASVAATFHLFGLYFVITLPQDYRSQEVALGCWAIMAAASVILVTAFHYRRESATLARGASLAVVGAAGILAADCQPWGILGFANWAIGDAGWILALTAAYRPLREAAAGWTAVVITNAIIITLIASSLADHLMKFIGILVGVSVVQGGAAIGLRLMNHTATVTSIEVSRASELVATRMADDEARLHRFRFHSDIDRKIIDLLRSIGEGLLDPHDVDTQRRCRSASDILRQSSMLRRAGAGDLVKLLSVAARQGLRFDFPVVDSLECVPPPHREQIVEVLRAALTFAKPGEGVVTIQDNIDLIMPVTAGPSDAISGEYTKPLSVSLRFDITADNGQFLRERVRLWSGDALSGLRIELDIIDHSGDYASNDKGGLAWLIMVYRP